MIDFFLGDRRYCPNDLFIAEAMEKFYAIDHRRSMGGTDERELGWVSKEVAAA